MAQENLMNGDQLLDLLSGKAAPVEQTETTQTQETTEQTTETQQTETQTETATTKTIEDYNKMISEKFGYGNIDDLLNGDAVNKVTKFDEIKNKLSEYEAEVPMLFEEFEKTGNPFANEAVYKLNHLQKTHPELDFQTAVTLVNTDLTQMSSADALLLSKKLNEPELNEKQAQKLLAMELGFDNWQELKDNDDADKALIMDAKAAKAKKDLSKYNVSDVKFNPETPALTEKIQEKLKTQREGKEQAYAKIEETWSPLTQGFEKNFNEFPISIETKDKKVEKFSNIVLSAEDKKVFSKAVIDYVKAKGYSEVNENNVNEVQRYLADLIILEKHATMTKIAVDKAVSDAKIEWEKSRFNPSGTGAGEGVNKAPEGKTGLGLMDILDSQVKRENW